MNQFQGANAAPVRSAGETRPQATITVTLRDGRTETATIVKHPMGWKYAVMPALLQEMASEPGARIQTEMHRSGITDACRLTDPPPVRGGRSFDRLPFDFNKET